MAEEMLSYSHHDVQDRLMSCRFEVHTSHTGPHSSKQLFLTPSDATFVTLGMESAR